MATKITAPDDRFSGSTYIGPTILEFTDGVATTDVQLRPGTVRYLEKYGYAVEAEEGGPDGPFDPSKHNIDEVRSYLDGLDDTDPDAHDAEVVRVLEAEKAGKSRKSIIESIEGTPDQGGDDE